MKPRMHMKVVGVSPLVGVVVFFLGFGILALAEAPIWQFGAMAAYALFMTLASWAAARWLIRADCPKCAAAMKLGKNRRSFIYVCPRCQTVVDSEVTIAQMYGVRDPAE
jgi:hypothetical protein